MDEVFGGDDDQLADVRLAGELRALQRQFARMEALRLVDNCTRLRFTPARRMLDYWCQHADAEAADQAADAPQRPAHTTAPPGSP